MLLQETVDFFQNAMDESGLILRSILDDKEAYIEAKKNNPRWSDLTLELSKFQQQALVCLSFFKYGMKEGRLLK